MEPRLWTRDLMKTSISCLRLLTSANTDLTKHEIKNQRQLFQKSVCSQKYSNLLDERMKNLNMTVNKEHENWHRKSNKEIRQKIIDEFMRRTNVSNDQLIKKNPRIKRQKVKNILSTLAEDDDFNNYIRKGSGRLIVSWLIYQTYLNLKNKEIIVQNKQEIDSLKEMISSNTQYHINGETSALDIVMNCKCGNPLTSCDSQSYFDHRLCNAKYEDNMPINLGKNDHLDLKQRLHQKYRQPSDEKVRDLSKTFPQPELLFNRVMQPALDAGLQCYHVQTSSHLNDFYWKTRIRLFWPRNVSCTGMHGDKDTAISRAYLMACQMLMDLGLIVAPHYSLSQPVNCDSVVDSLEQISEFSDTALKNSKGKGFKIILEKVKKSCNVSNFASFNEIDGNVCNEWPIKTHDTEHLLDDLTKPSQWSCCVPVGWPIPFTVRMIAPSLPSAQMLALLTVSSNLKILGLTCRSSEINSQSLQKAVFRDMSKQWGKCIQSSSKKTTHDLNLSESHDVDAIVYVDASSRGYGAYLKLNDSRKVCWMCESWLDQPHLISKIFYCLQNQLLLHTTMAELFAIVSTIFTWKKKLHHRHVVCYSDNQTAVTLISVVGKLTKPIKKDTFISGYDFLVNNLLETCKAYNIQLEVTWVPRQYNKMADGLANGQVHEFKNMFLSNAAVSRTKAKQLSWKDDLL